MSDYEVETTTSGKPEDAGTPDIVQEALDRFRLCVEAESKQRKREKDALEFQVPELQWSEEIRNARRAQTVAGISLATRPMLSIPKLDQPIQLVLNQEKAAHLGVQVHPLNEDADEDTAEVLQGLYRAIEVDSRAGLSRSWAFERLVKAGRGVYRILKEYDETSDHPSDQKIVIKRVYEQGSVYGDPAATEPDKSDGEFVLVVEDIPQKRYKRLFPESKLASYSDEEFVALGSQHPDWISGEKDARAIRVCEYFYYEYEQEQVEWGEAGEDGKRPGRTKEKRVVHWCKVNAEEELDKAIWDGQYLPFVWLTRELIPFDGDQRCVGLIEPNKDAQRMFNYSASESVALAALEGKAAPAVDPQQIQGYEEFWQQRNVRNFPFLPFRRYVNGQDYGQPFYVQADMSHMQMNAMLLAQAGEFIHAGTFTMDASLGNASPNTRTKGGTLALQQQSEQANSHWIQILADIGMTHEARIVLDLIPHVYDRPGRVARILDTEDNPKQVMFNAPFRMNGKKPQMAPQRPVVPGQPAPPMAHDVKHYDLTKGRYGVTVSIGKAYKSRVEQGKDNMAQLFESEPELFKVLGDLYFKYDDAPWAHQASERMKKMLPPQLQEKDQQGDPRQELEQAKAALAQMQQHLKELEPERMKAQVQIETAKAKSQSDTQIAAAKTSADVQITKMNNAAKILIARIAADKAASGEQVEDFEERLALAANLAHDSEQAALDRQHEQSQMQHQAAMQAAGAGQDAAMADQGHQNALEQGQQGIDGQMAAQQQAADLAPEPQAGE